MSESTPNSKPVTQARDLPELPELPEFPEFPEFNDEWIPLFSSAAVQIFKVQCKLELKASPSFNRGTRNQTSPDIGAVIGITSPRFRGSAALWFPKAVFLHVVSQLFNEEVHDIDSTNEDAAAELLNMIFGHVKTPLNKKGYDVQMAIPSTLRGSQIEAKYLKGSRVQVLAFQTPVGEFYIELLSQWVETPEKGEVEKPLPAAQPNTSPLSTKDRATFCMHLIRATVHTLKHLCQVDVTPGKPFDRLPQYKYPFDLASTVGITSQDLNGTFVMEFKQDVLLRLASKMFDEPIATYTSEIDDMVSELVNISLGTAKKSLRLEGHIIEMALPTIVKGSDLQAILPKGQRLIVVPFQSEIGEFHVELDIRR